MNKKEFTTLCLMVLVAFLIICGYSTYCHNKLKEQGVYLDIECPICGSDEVLDMGTDYNGNVNGQCYDCKAKFYIENDTTSCDEDEEEEEDYSDVCPD